MEVLEQFFKDKGSSENTMKLYQYAVMHYENLHKKDIEELLEEADREEEQGIRWKKRSIRRYLIQFRNDLYTSKSENTAKKYMSCIKTLYRHYEIELQPLPSFDSKQIDKTYELSFEDILTKQEIKDAYYSWRSYAYNGETEPIRRMPWNILILCCKTTTVPRNFLPSARSCFA